MAYQIEPGHAFPMGASINGKGVNFAIFSSRAEKIELCLFDGEQETRLVLPARSGNIHHGFVPGLAAGQHYGYRVHGQSSTEHGVYFNPHKLLIDPYSKAIHGIPSYRTPEEHQRFSHLNHEDNASFAAKSIVVPPHEFNWENDQHPNTPWEKTIIYEAHVKGLTKQFPDLAHAGTYLALADQRIIACLKDLGVTALELLPIQQHLDEWHLQAGGKRNYWGYNTYSHFAVEPGYATHPEHADNELRTAIKALHQAGIEVILDVVYNHTAEQDLEGPLLCQRGIDNPAWYWVDETGHYQNWTGTGNTLHICQRNVTRWVLDSMRYWVEQFHIDGFRFDLGTILGREPGFNAYGRFMQALYQDPTLASRKLIAEPWDIGRSGYQLGNFPEPFAEWNDRFRDDMRRFWLQGSGQLGLFAERMAGSADIFRHDGRRPSAGINFITAHDGFTLADLVSYNEKHNEANGENNRDGHNNNLSNNHGAEGATENPAINQARLHAAQALLASLLLANGTPMLLAGDEFGNSQQGNNNGYCQDNEITWLNRPEDEYPLQAYTRELIAIRRQIPLLAENRWWDERVSWLAADGTSMTESSWHNTASKALQILIDQKWLLLINAKHQQQTFTLPKGRWICLSAPSETHQQNLNNQCQAGHMGIWVYYLKQGESK